MLHEAAVSDILKTRTSEQTNLTCNYFTFDKCRLLHEMIFSLRKAI